MNQVPDVLEFEIKKWRTINEGGKIVDKEYNQLKEISWGAKSAIKPGRPLETSTTATVTASQSELTEVKTP